MDREKNKSDFENVKRILDKEASEIQRLTERLDKENIEEMVFLLDNCKGKVITSGCGTSGAAAKKIAHTLNCINKPALFLSPSDALHGGMGVLQKEDLMIFFSKGGHTFELEAMIDSCKKKKVKIVLVTENLNSTLAQKSDFILKVGIEKEPDAFNMLATASTLAVIAVFDAISITMANNNEYSKEEFLVIHPGGEVGERLSKQIQN